MVALTLRRFAAEHNFILASRYIYGKRDNMVFSVFSSTFKFHIAAVGHEFTLKYKLQFSQHLIGKFGFRHGIRIKYICEDKIIILSLPKSAGLRKISAIIDVVCSFVSDKLIPQNSCFICTQPCSNEIIIDNSIVALAHDYCIKNMNNRLDHHSDVKNTHRGSYDKGCFASLIGAFLGGFIWVCLHPIFDYSWLFAALIGLTARDFYYLFRCRLGKKTRGIIISMTAFIVFMSVWYIHFFGLEKLDMPIDILNVFTLLGTDPDYFVEFIELMGLGFLAGIIGLIPTFIDKFEHSTSSHHISNRVQKNVSSKNLFR